MVTNEIGNLKKEILFYYESRMNPNGDPGFENQPRLMPDGTIIVTDVRIKRTIRDYAKSKYGETLFVDYGEDGTPVTADKRAKEILKNLDDVVKGLICKTFDVPLFGALVPIRSEKGKGSSQKLTGPVQFAIGRSVNQVEIINPLISGRFVGKEKKQENADGTQSDDQKSEQFSTFGKFYAVDYALIKIQGIVNPMNLGEYLNDAEATDSFRKAEEKLVACLWDGTNSLVTRSKYPQRSIFLLEVTYDSVIYNDLPILVEENPELKGKIRGLTANPLKFDKFISAMSSRKGKIKNVKIASCRELANDAAKLAETIEKVGVHAELVKTEDNTI
jgi:CRISPR-associated protein Csh2